jgi:hypothetical protein
MRKSLAGNVPDKGGKQKKMMLIGISVILGSIILVAIAIVAFSMLGKGSGGAATPTPIVGTPTPTVTPTPTPTPVPTPTPTPEPTGGWAYSYDGPFILRARLNGVNGQCVVGLNVPAVIGPSVNVSNIYMNVVCDGRTYERVWTLKGMDWNNADNDLMLEPEENIATYIDTVKLGISQGRPITIKLYKNGDFLQEIAVAPTV